MGMSCPEIHAASLDARKANTSAISRGRPAQGRLRNRERLHLRRFGYCETFRFSGAGEYRVHQSIPGATLRRQALRDRVDCRLTALTQQLLWEEYRQANPDG
jgi:hypothetical protein